MATIHDANFNSIFTPKARITKAQLAIYKAHAAAFKNGSFDSYEKISKQELIQLLNDGKTHGGLWEAIKTNYVSITSQLLMHPDIFNTMTGAAAKGMQTGFKITLNNLKIQ